MDSEQRRDASDVKTHKEILSLLKELDTIEKRVKNLPVSEDSSADAEVVLQDVEITEPPVKTIQKPRPELPMDIIHRHAHKKQDRLSLLDLYKKQRATERKSKRSFFSHKAEKTPLVPSAKPEVHRPIKRRRGKERPIQSTFKLYITEEGTLGGLDLKKPKPPKATKEQPQEAEEPGFKGKLKRLAKKIIPRASKKGEASQGIGSRIKGIVKRKPKEQK